MRRALWLTLIACTGCGGDAVPTPNTDPAFEKKLEQDVERMQKTGDGEQKQKRDE